MDNWADKVDVEDGIDVDEMKNNGDGKEAEPPKARHLDLMNVDVRPRQEKQPLGDLP